MRLFLPLLSLFTLHYSLFSSTPTESHLGAITIVTAPTAAPGIITLRASLPAGDRFAPTTNPAIPQLTAAILDKGTTTHDKFAIAAQLEALGAQLSFASNDTYLLVSGKCLATDLPTLLQLLSEQLHTPAISPTELELLKTQLIGRYRRAQESTNYQADLAFTRAIYPKDHPNYSPTPDEMIAAIQRSTPEDLRTFHQTHYLKSPLTLIAVGTITPETFQQQIQQHFPPRTHSEGRALSPKAPSPSNNLTTSSPTLSAEAPSPALIRVPMPDKTNITVIIGERTNLRYTDPENLPLQIATAALGSGFTGRLMATVRDKEGLTYHINSALSNNTNADGDWRITANFAPDLLEKGIASTQRELTSWITEGITQEELDRIITNLSGRHQVALSTTDGLASAIQLTLHRKLPLTWLETFPSQLQQITLPQVNAAIKSVIHPTTLQQVQAGTFPDNTSK